MLYRSISILKVTTIFTCGGLFVLLAQFALSQSVLSKQSGWQTIEEFQQLVDNVWVAQNDESTQKSKEMLIRHWLAHGRRDAAAVVDELTDDYVYYNVTDDGPQLMVSGKEKVRELMGDYYTSTAMEGYLGYRLIPLGIAGNIALQIETEAYELDDGTRKDVQILGILELEDGKQKRFWSFPLKTLVETP